MTSSGDVGGLNSNDYVTNSYGHLFDRLFQKFYNFLWLRSPGIYDVGVALLVYPSGGVDSYGSNFVGNSYGRIQSPIMYDAIYAWSVRPGGDLDTFNVFDFSYGFL